MTETNYAPDVVIVGAQRCATTWALRVFEQNGWAALNAPGKPEPKVLLEGARDAYWREIYRQLSCIRSAQLVAGHRYLGWVEKSTRYFTCKDAPSRLRELNPNAKIVIMVRHPVERAVSHWRFSTANGVETRDFVTAIREESARLWQATEEEGHTTAYLSVGMYDYWIQLWADYFPREQIWVSRSYGYNKTDACALLSFASGEDYSSRAIMVPERCNVGSPEVKAPEWYGSDEYRSLHKWARDILNWVEDFRKEQKYV